MNLKSSLITQKPIFSPSLPVWWKKLQEDSWQEFISCPIPSIKDELWRFSPISMTDISAFCTPPINSDSSLYIKEAENNGYSSAFRVITLNDQAIFYPSLLDLPAGVLLLSVDEALLKYESLFKKYFTIERADLGSQKFISLHYSRIKSGYFLYIPPGIHIPYPIEFWHCATGNQSAIFPHTQVVIGEGAVATVIEHFFTPSEEKILAVGLSHLSLHQSAQLTHITINRSGNMSSLFHMNNTYLQEKSHAILLQMNLSGQYIRTESESNLIGADAFSKMLSITLGSQNCQIVDQRTFQNHLVRSAKSDLLYHNSLNDRSKTIFSGLIKVALGAHETNAYQKVANLILSADAEAHSMPGLEILADNVRCTHGATTAEISLEELFYMMSRGISPLKAKHLILRGFFNKVLSHVQHDLLEKYLNKLLDGIMNC